MTKKVYFSCSTKKKASEIGCLLCALRSRIAQNSTTSNSFQSVTKKEKDMGVATKNWP